MEAIGITAKKFKAGPHLGKSTIRLNSGRDIGPKKNFRAGSHLGGSTIRLNSRRPLLSPFGLKAAFMGEDARKQEGVMAKEHRCWNCELLLALENEGQLFINYKEDLRIVLDSNSTGLIVCRRCRTPNRFQVKPQEGATKSSK